MSLTHALLGLLQYIPSTGYDIKMMFDESIHFFWNSTMPQIYRTLNQMEAEGLLTVAVEYQDGKPNRKVYTVTDAGLEEFQRWLAETPEFPEMRYSILIKIFLGLKTEPRFLIAHLQAWREHHANLLQRYEEECPLLIEKYKNITGAVEDAMYWEMTRNFGIRLATMMIEWCDATLATIQEETEK
ncbi:transcriptional regulator, PadR-like family [Desulfofarcimen acetoxidans DSM 771]|jgi:DNA-binding PadR family transcriptional regulator|uniref:Transcriptional regulator, PadR-like family n=1 Tax=Desulfofarcimen acetoxidans (strain ATCC 49208 / DSM 771 / KCTC 5769 / VKM B-1644 / 5575) TaxID=485916 RepID=C8VY82_DESAS|nr:PadR family transcriptional regulator [Desulfofarcimen acetoxidans]ACV62763.1 transcriptional regulator, PadR-like family [Desulfofarcimen acetoxidans DSM 771]